MADKKDINLNPIIIHGSKKHTINAIVSALLTDKELVVENPYPNFDTNTYNTFLKKHEYEIKYQNNSLVVAKTNKENAPIIESGNTQFHIDDTLALTLSLKFGEKIDFMREESEDFNRTLLILRRFGVKFADDDPEEPSSVMRVESFTPTKIKFNFLESNYYLAGFLARLSVICNTETEILSKFNVIDSLPDEVWPLNIVFSNLKKPMEETDELEKRLQRLQGTQKQQSYHYRINTTNDEMSEKLMLNADPLECAYLGVLSIVGHNEPSILGNLHPFAPDNAFIRIISKLGAKAEIIKSGEPEQFFMKVSSGKPVAKKTNEQLMRICNYSFGPLALLACFAEGKTILRGLAKSSSLWQSRIDGITSILSTADVRVGEIEDGIVIEPPQELSDIKHQEFDDPYLQLSQFAAAVAINSKSLDAEFFDFSKHYPQFQEYLNTIRAKPKSLAN
jgi:5-enolpyruvylshikimate-3-phosphate synthase